jgi:hypothetical protein
MACGFRLWTRGPLFSFPGITGACEGGGPGQRSWPLLLQYLVAAQLGDEGVVATGSSARKRLRSIGENSDSDDERNSQGKVILVSRIVLNADGMRVPVMDKRSALFIPRNYWSMRGGGPFQRTGLYCCSTWLRRSSVMRGWLRRGAVRGKRLRSIGENSDSDDERNSQGKVILVSRIVLNADGMRVPVMDKRSALFIPRNYWSMRGGGPFQRTGLYCCSTWLRRSSVMRGWLRRGAVRGRGCAA